MKINTRDLISVNCKIRDFSGNITDKTIIISKLEILYHFAIVGMGKLPSITKYRRLIGTFYRFFDYFDFTNGNFSLPDKKYQDPTEQGQFSNLVGKAVANALLARLDDVQLSVNYEGFVTMNYPNNRFSGKRPDLVCLNSDNKIIVVECKGLSQKSLSDSKIDDVYAEQFRDILSDLDFDYAVVSASYNLYRDIEVKNSYFNYLPNDPIIGRQPHRQGPKPNPEDLFKEWVRNFYGFMLDLRTSPFVEENGAEKIDGTEFDKYKIVDYPDLQLLFPKKLQSENTDSLADAYFSDFAENKVIITEEVYVSPLFFGIKHSK
jgi:hypothetical protein